MYKIFGVFLLVALIGITGSSAWAAGPVITVYFGGTGVWSGWKNADKSKIGSPELLTTLAAIQRTPADSHAVFIPGVGVDSNGVENIVKMGNPADILFGGRGWDACMDEAADEIRKILVGGNKSDAIVNLVGWSRGGVTAIAFAKKRLTGNNDLNSRITRINILALDPVTGDSNAMQNPLTLLTPEQLGVGYFLIPDKVAEYVGIYADDERSVWFGPILPRAEDAAKTQTYLFRVPGSHETLVGNRLTHGHSTYAPGGLSNPLGLVPQVTDDHVRAVGWTTKVFVKELLGTPGWGNVRFDPDPVDYNDRWKWEPDQVDSDAKLKEQFMSNVSFMNANDFNSMRKYSFGQLIFGWEYFGPGGWFGLQENRYEPGSFGSPVSAHNNQRPLQDTHREQGCFIWCWDYWRYSWNGLTNGVPNLITDGTGQYSFLWERGGMRARYTPNQAVNAGTVQ